MPIPPVEFPTYNSAIEGALRRPDAFGDGGLPGFLGLEMADVGPGRLTCSMEVRDDLLNPFGALHGGVIAALTDHVLGAVMYTVIDRGSWAATTEFKLNLLAPVRSGSLTAEAVVISMGKRTAVVRVDVTNDGNAAAAGQGTVTIVPPRPA